MRAELTAPEHEHSEGVVMAAQWLCEQPDAPAGVIPLLRSRFNLTALEATEACAMARRFRINRRAFG
ncbi:hypothetical protein HNR26_003791 [Rhizobium rosettiformans]|uniref:Uncharacterized protein n=2 Tax=Rhizobium rosettiformans TaxID=1368430 RepID=A0A4S8PPU2_9HYPH|nr:hypothetical protein [Rhizobium rosettiformans]MBB5277710.1 hypothetical protein [Rhizobium rosettiformans]THV33080.1 hypothetical protein FAA86_17965 [Rhizobium rosettiformans W3]